MNMMNHIQNRVEIARTFDRFHTLTQLYAQVTDDYNLVLTSVVNGICTHSRTFSLDLLDNLPQLVIDALKKIASDRIDDDNRKLHEEKKNV